VSQWGPAFALNAAQLSALQTPALQSRSAELNKKLGAIRDKTAAQRAHIKSRGKRLIKPAIKLTGSTIAGIGGILLTPFTISAALGFSALGVVFNAMDALDFARSSNTIVNLWRRRHGLLAGAKEIEHEMDLIEAILKQRRRFVKPGVTTAGGP
jgi:hypothetical protein